MNRSAAHSRFRALLMTILLPIFMSGCGQGLPLAGSAGDKLNSGLQGTLSLQQEQVPLRLGFAQVGTESGWRAANTVSIQENAAKHRVELAFTDAQQQQEHQIESIRSFIQDDMDVIAFSPVVQSGWDEVLLEAKQAGIPVILTDRAVDSRDTSLYTTFIGSDFVEEGRKAGRWLTEELKDRTGPVHIAELRGTDNSAPTIDRHRGFVEVIRNASPYMEIRMSGPGEFTREGGREIMTQFLKTAAEENTPIDVVFSHNDDMSLGAIEAIEAAGLRPGKDILLISFDGIREAFEAMAAGKINVIVECNPLFGDQLMQAARKIVAGTPVPKRIVTREGLYTPESAKRELPGRKY